VLSVQWGQGKRNRWGSKRVPKKKKKGHSRGAKKEKVGLDAGGLLILLGRQPFREQVPKGKKTDQRDKKKMIWRQCRKKDNMEDATQGPS